MPDVERLRDEVERVMEASLQGVWAEYPRYCESARDAIVDLIEKRDVERITTTERHAEREQIAQAAYEAFAVASASKIGQLPPFDSIGPAKQDWLAVADAVLPFIERERVRVVEGLRERLTAILTGMEFSEEELADVLAVFDD